MGRRLYTPLSERAHKGGKVTSTGSQSDQYWSPRQPVLVTMGEQYCSDQRPVLVVIPPSEAASYPPHCEYDTEEHKKQRNSGYGRATLRRRLSPETERGASPYYSGAQAKYYKAVRRQLLVRIRTTIGIRGKPLFVWSPNHYSFAHGPVVVCTRMTIAFDFPLYDFTPPPPRMPAEKPCRVATPYSSDAVALRNKGIQPIIVIFVTTRGS